MARYVPALPTGVAPVTRRRVVLAVLALAVLVVVGVLAARGIAGASKRAARTGTGGTATASVPVSPSPTSTTPAAGSGHSASPAKPQPPATFHQPVYWSDGLRFAVLKMATGTITKRDLGAPVGGDKTTFIVKLTNGRTRSYPASGIALTVTYGPHHSRAAALHNITLKHVRFPVTLASHRSATARFTFAIPASDRKDVIMTVRPTDHAVRPDGVFAGSTL